MYRVMILNVRSLQQIGKRTRTEKRLLVRPVCQENADRSGAPQKAMLNCAVLWRPNFETRPGPSSHTAVNTLPNTALPRAEEAGGAQVRYQTCNARRSAAHTDADSERNSRRQSSIRAHLERRTSRAPPCEDRVAGGVPLHPPAENEAAYRRRRPKKRLGARPAFLKFSREAACRRRSTYTAVLTFCLEHVQTALRRVLSYSSVSSQTSRLRLRNNGQP